MFAINPSADSNKYGNTPLRIISGLIESEDKKIAIDIAQDDESQRGSRILDEYYENLDEEEETGLVRHIKGILEEDLNGRGEPKLLKWQPPIHRSKVEDFEEKDFDKSDLIFLRMGPQCSTKTIMSCDKRSLVDEKEFKEMAEDRFDISVLEPKKIPEKLE